MCNSTTTSTIEQIQEWISLNLPSEPTIVAGQCLEFSKVVHQQFPELRIVRGVVSSPENLDNIPNAGYNKQYPHAWLEDQEGNRIDPTAQQFMLLGELDYHEFKELNKVKKCFSCGKYFESANGDALCDTQSCQDFNG